jgi:hypothetical protein
MEICWSYSTGSYKQGSRPDLDGIQWGLRLYSNWKGTRKFKSIYRLFPGCINWKLCNPSQLSQRIFFLIYKEAINGFIDLLLKLFQVNVPLHHVLFLRKERE